MNHFYTAHLTTTCQIRLDLLHSKQHKVLAFRRNNGRQHVFIPLGFPHKTFNFRYIYHGKELEKPTVSLTMSMGIHEDGQTYFVSSRIDLTIPKICISLLNFCFISVANQWFYFLPKQITKLSHTIKIVHCWLNSGMFLHQ